MPRAQPRGYSDVFRKTIEFRGIKASYTQAERRIVEPLPGDQQALVHLLKHLTAGEIMEADDVRSQETAEA